MQSKRKLGAHFEEHVCDFLCGHGLRLIAKNKSSRFGEIDLVMQDGSCLVFVEVRYRKNALYGNAATTVSIAKQKKIIHAAYDWMLKQHIESESCEYRFDIFAITGKEYQWIRNAFSFCN